MFFAPRLDLLPAESGEKLTEHFLQELLNILLAYISKSYNRSSKVLDFHHPHQLKDGLEGFSLDLPEQPDNLEQLLVDCRNTLKYGVKTGSNTCSTQRYGHSPVDSVVGSGPDLPIFSQCPGHPRFFNQLSSGLDLIGLAGEWLTSTANTNMLEFIHAKGVSPVHVPLCSLSYFSGMLPEFLVSGIVRFYNIGFGLINILQIR